MYYIFSVYTKLHTQYAIFESTDSVFFEHN